MHLMRRLNQLAPALLGTCMLAAGLAEAEVKNGVNHPKVRIEHPLPD